MTPTKRAKLVNNDTVLFFNIDNDFNIVSEHIRSHLWQNGEKPDSYFFDTTLLYLIKRYEGLYGGARNNFFKELQNVLKKIWIWFFLQ